MPFYLRSGKRLAKRVTEVAIEFKGVPHRFFHKASGELLPNVLRLHIQPDEGVSLKFGVKVPGSVLQIQSVYMDFPYAKLGAPDRRRLRAAAARRDARRPDALHPRRRGRARVGGPDAGPRGLGDACRPPDFPNYAAGTFGPEAADRFLEKDQRRWRTL